MKKQIKLGVVCLARKTFDYEAAFKLYKEIINDLHSLENTEVIAIAELVIELADASKAALQLLKENIDGLVIISGTFHLGHLALELKKYLNKPFLLWGLNELPYNGGKIRLNSVCGVNLNASNLYKSGYYDYTYSVGDKINSDWLDAIRIEKALKDVKLALIGFRANGFFNLDVDDLSVYRKFGILIDHYELSDVFNTTVKDELIEEYKVKLNNNFVSRVSNEQFNMVALLCAKFKTFMQQNNVNTIAMRCWPESARDFGISPCASMSLLQSEGYIMSCEGDIDCAISMVAHSAMGAETPFMADLSQVNFKEEFALMWHCGVAPCNLTDGVCECSLDTYFAGGKGVTADFAMRSGEVNMMRLDSVGGKYRLFFTNGLAVPCEKSLRGTYAKVIFNNDINQVIDKVVYNGIAHHLSMAYGKYDNALKIYARNNAIEVIES